MLSNTAHALEAVLYIAGEGISLTETAEKLNVTEQELKNFDVIQLGGIEILYDADDGTDNDNIGSHGNTTGIDLENTTNTGLSTVKHFTNYSPFAEMETKRANRNQKVVLILVSLLGIIVLALLVALLVVMMKRLS